MRLFNIDSALQSIMVSLGAVREKLRTKLKDKHAEIQSAKLFYVPSLIFEEIAMNAWCMCYEHVATTTHCFVFNATIR